VVYYWSFLFKKKSIYYFYLLKRMKRAPAWKPFQDLSEDVDSYYCPHCLENMPSSEAMLCGMRCSKCWECPVCSSTLTPCIANPSSKEQTYHFACSYCRWSSKGSWAVYSTSWIHPTPARLFPTENGYVWTCFGAVVGWLLCPLAPPMARCFFFVEGLAS